MNCIRSKHSKAPHWGFFLEKRFYTFLVLNLQFSVMPKVPKLKRWPKGLKARINKQKKYDDRVAENKRIAQAIAAARKKLK